MSGLCEDKVVLVTGGSQGIGLAISQHLAREGACVLIVDILDAEGKAAVKNIQDAGGRADYCRCDVTDAAQVESAVAAATSTFGRLDCLVNNAGIGITGPFVDMTEQDFDRIVAINLKGSFLFLSAVMKQLLAQGQGGSIVNIASVGGVVGTPEYSLYAMTKHGVVALTKCLALEYSDQGIRTNAVCPGPILTAMAERAAREQGLADANELAREQRVPMGRLGTPEEVAEAAAWLCSDRSSHTTGSNLFVDGGYTAQ